MIAAQYMPAGVIPAVPINDKKAYPVYAKCVELDIPIFVNGGVPGPRVPMASQYPGLVDEVCWFFPDLKFVFRHCCEPWVDLTVKLMLKWPNLYYSTTAFAPTLLPAGDHRLRQHPRRRQGLLRRLLPVRARAGADLPRVARAHLEGRGVAEVPSPERTANPEAGSILSSATVSAATAKSAPANAAA